MGKVTDKNHTFWEHLDDLRGCLIKIAIITVLFGVIAFLFKETLFDVVFAPRSNDFITYRVFGFVSNRLSPADATLDAIPVTLINTRLAEQFLIHMKMAIYAGLLFASPYIIYALFRFISPALYKNERKYALQTVAGGYIMFIMGVLLSYFLIFPLTFRFLGSYQVSSDVANMITLQSYVETMMMLNVMMGIVFEIPVLCWLFAKLGFLSAEFMSRYRKHAIVVIVAISAIITPTADIFTLLLVSIPIYLLYEASIFIVKRTNRKSTIPAAVPA